MKSTPSAQRLELRLMMTALAVASLPLFAALASAKEASAKEASPTEYGAKRYTDPAAIDRAVARFTGAGIGEVGGARLPADRRLRLAPCAQPLGVQWHGRAKTIVQVRCPGPDSWRIFIATRSPPQEAAAAKVVARGDPITVLIRGRGFTVQQSAEAMESGAIGDWIAVRTQSGPQTRTRAGAGTIRARIERPGLAIIPAG